MTCPARRFRPLSVGILAAACGDDTGMAAAPDTGEPPLPGPAYDPGRRWCFAPWMALLQLACNGTPTQAARDSAASRVDAPEVTGHLVFNNVWGEQPPGGWWSATLSSGGVLEVRAAVIPGEALQPSRNRGGKGPAMVWLTHSVDIRGPAEGGRPTDGGQVDGFDVECAQSSTGLNCTLWDWLYYTGEDSIQNYSLGCTRKDEGHLRCSWGSLGVSDPDAAPFRTDTTPSPVYTLVQRQELEDGPNLRAAQAVELYLLGGGGR
jgi:hypothetical protein